MSITKTNNPVYSYRAAEELDNDSWGTLVAATPAGSMWDEVKPTFVGWENEYKTATGLPLPGSWRSAKSVVKSAIEAGVSLKDKDGKVLGKTAVEAAIKANKGDISDKDPSAVLAGLIKTSMDYAKKHGLDWDHAVKGMRS